MKGERDGLAVTVAERSAECERSLSVFEADALEDSFEAPKKGGRAPPTLDEWMQMLG